MKKIIVYLLIVFIFFPFYVQGNDNLQVAVSIVPGKTFIKAVGGNKVDVLVMIPPGNSPGNYRPSPEEYKKFSDSSLYFSMGVPADIAYILPRVKKLNNNIKVIKLHREVAKNYREREFTPGKRDPHFWLSPKRVKVVVDIIAEELAALDNENKNFYYENAQEYREKLDKLDRSIRKTLAELKNKTFIIYHPSFGYFANDYDLNMIAIEKNGKDATVKRLKQIIDLARKNGIKNIFCQREIDSRQTQALAEELGGRTIELSPLSPHYINNLKKTARILRGYYGGN